MRRPFCRSPHDNLDAIRNSRVPCGFLASRPPFRYRVLLSHSVRTELTHRSPEQARGQKVDGHTDLFNLGGVLYRLWTGRLPFEGTTVMAILTALAADEPTPKRPMRG